MLIQMLIETEQDQIHVSQFICFYNSQIHLQAVMYHFEHTNDDFHY